MVRGSDPAGFINITEEVEDALRESGIRERSCLVNAMHITASVFTNNDQRSDSPVTESLLPPG